MLYNRLHPKSVAYNKSICIHTVGQHISCIWFDVEYFWLSWVGLSSSLQIVFRSTPHGFVLRLRPEEQQLLGACSCPGRYFLAFRKYQDYLKFLHSENLCALHTLSK